MSVKQVASVLIINSMFRIRHESSTFLIPVPWRSSQQLNPYLSLVISLSWRRIKRLEADLTIDWDKGRHPGNLSLGGCEVEVGCKLQALGLLQMLGLISGPKINVATWVVWVGQGLGARRVRVEGRRCSSAARCTTQSARASDRWSALRAAAPSRVFPTPASTISLCPAVSASARPGPGSRLLALFPQAEAQR